MDDLSGDIEEMTHAVVYARYSEESGIRMVVSRVVRMNVRLGDLVRASTSTCIMECKRKEITYALPPLHVRASTSTCVIPHKRKPTTGAHIGRGRLWYVRDFSVMLLLDDELH